MKQISDFGQLDKGDAIKIVGRSPRDNYQAVLVHEVLNPGSDKEEIIVDSRKNYYFITSMLVSGESWAKEVYKLD